MSVYRVVWNFMEQSAATWGEVYYVNAATPAAAVVPPAPLLQSRLVMLHPNNTLTTIRASDVAATRTTAVNILNLAGTGILGAGQSIAGDAVVFNLTGQAGGTRKIWLRGMPDDYIVRNPSTGRPAPPAPLVLLMNAWLANLQTAGYGVYRVQGQTGGTSNNIRMTQLDGSAGNGTSVVTTAIAHGYSPADRLIIGRASPKDLPSLNGRWSVISTPTLTTFVIPYQTPGKQIISSNTAQCREAVYLDLSVINSSVSGFAYYTTRATKNPITRSRGARRAVRIRTSV